MTILNISALPLDLIWNEGTDGEFSLADAMSDVVPSIRQLMFDGVLADSKSFGFALANPMAILRADWNDPFKLIAMVFHYGPEGPRYAANACRKIRAAAREGKDTETLRFSPGNRFVEPVKSAEEDGTFLWGDFPFGGATFVPTPRRTLLTAVSTFPEEQDPLASRLIGSHLGLAMFKSDEIAAGRDGSIKEALIAMGLAA